MRFVYKLFCVLLLIYVLLPGPSKVSDFMGLSDSTKSTLSGDTWQVPNVVAYFTNYYRDYVTYLYYGDYWSKSWVVLPPIKLNYPPEFAYSAIKDQTKSTYLEEFVYPLKNSLFVNGIEPYQQSGEAKFSWSESLRADNEGYDNKVTLRYYPSNVVVRLLVWFSVVLSVYLLWKVGGGIKRE